MKYTTVLTIAALCASSVIAAPEPVAAAVAEPKVRWRWNYAYMPAMGASAKLKRAVDVASEALESTSTEFDPFLDYYCSLPGDKCKVAKRSAFASAVAEAHAAADPEAYAAADPKVRWRWNYCYLPSMGASAKLKRAAEEVKSILGEHSHEDEADFEKLSEEEKEKAAYFKTIIEKLGNAAHEVHLE